MSHSSHVSSTSLLSWIRHRSPAFFSRLGITENTFMVMLALAIGVLAGLGNFVFRQTIDLIHWLVIEQGKEFFAISFEHWSTARFWTVLFPVAGGC